MSQQDQVYRLMFSGKLLEGQFHEDVADRLEKMLKLPHDKAMQLIIGRKHYLNKEFNQQEGERLMAYVREAGAECRLVPASQIKKKKLPEFDAPTAFDINREK
jgi:hypothetical protein